MRDRARIVALGAILVAIGIACSTVSANDPATDDGQLGTIESSEIVGSLSYGQTSASVIYTPAPRYRAFSFDGTQGDAVDIVVHSTDGVADAWLQDNASRTLAYDVATSHDAHITQTLASSGAFLIAFREATLKTSTFTVSLAKTPMFDAGVDSATDAPAPTTDAAVSDAASDASSNAYCTFTRSLTNANGCSLCVLPSPTTSTDLMSMVIDHAGGGTFDMQVGGGTGRTLHVNGVTTEFQDEGCSTVFALDGTQPSESWTSNSATVACGLANASANVQITVANGDQVSLTYSVGHSPGVLNCAIIHGCVSETLNCGGTLTATQQ